MQELAIGGAPLFFATVAVQPFVDASSVCAGSPGHSCLLQRGPEGPLQSPRLFKLLAA